MSNQAMYPADVVLKMLIAAYRAGFEGVLEMDEDTCREILAGSPAGCESDLHLMEKMRDHEEVKSTYKDKGKQAYYEDFTYNMDPYGGGYYQ